MNCTSIVTYKLTFFVLFLLVGGLPLKAQISMDKESAIEGRLLLDSIWAPIVYLSHIPTLNDMHTMSNEMIVAEATVDSTGYFSFSPTYLPKQDQLFRIHLSKKKAPAASLIIGGPEENHLFIIANRETHIQLESSPNAGMFREVHFSGYSPNKSLQKIDKLLTLSDSTRLKGSVVKGEFAAKAIQERLRQVADSSSHPIVSLYALYKSKFESNYPINQSYYDAYLYKWKDESSPYFNSFRTHFPEKSKITYVYYLPFAIGFFILGFVINQRLTVRKDRTKHQLKELSIQERKIFQLIKSGHTNKEISEEHNIGLSTVKSHVSNIYTKLNIKSRKEAMDF